MEISVREAAQRLGVDESRVRAMLRLSTLSGRLVSGRWLVDGDDLAHREAHRPPRGRPMSPARAWGLLSLLDGGRAPWLSPAERSQVKAQLRAAFSPLVASAPASSDAENSAAAGAVDRWRAMFKARSDVVAVDAHRAALPRLLNEDGVHEAGVRAAIRAGADLVSPSAFPELYVSADLWPELRKRYQLREGRKSPSLLVRVPRGVSDPFGGEAPGPAVLGADLLESDDYRLWAAGASMLVDLAAGYGVSAP